MRFSHFPVCYYLFLAVCSAVLQHQLVESFVPVALLPQSSKAINRPWPLKQSVPTVSTSLSSLQAIPPSVPYVLGHIVAGATGTPIVMRATKAGGWYRKIDLPSWTPPDRLFGPVWTTLYGMMGWSSYQVAKKSASQSRTWAMAAWILHLALNLSWAPIFFGLKNLRLGMVINIAIWLTLLGTVMPLYFSLSPLAAYLLIPYAAWLTFANFLNRSICKRNPTRNGYNEAKFQSQLSTLQEKAAEHAGL